VNEHGHRIIQVVDDNSNNICNDDIIIFFISSISSNVVRTSTTRQRRCPVGEEIIIRDDCINYIIIRYRTTTGATTSPLR
jgi:hypothetical protein